MARFLDDEIKIGTFLLRLPESQLKTHLLMRVDTLKKWTDFRSEVVAIISRAISTAQSQPTPMGVGAVGKGTSSKGGKGAKGGGKRNNQSQQGRSRSGITDHTSTNCPHSDLTCRKCGKVGWISGERVSICWTILASRGVEDFPERRTAPPDIASLLRFGLEDKDCS